MDLKMNTMRIKNNNLSSKLYEIRIRKGIKRRKIMHEK